jgi:hypothetical protein
MRVVMDSIRSLGLLAAYAPQPGVLLLSVTLLIAAATKQGLMKRLERLSD